MGRYSKELKLEITLKRITGESAIKLAKEYNLNSSKLVYAWEKTYKNGNINFTETRGKATGINKGRPKIIKRKDMTDMEYIQYLEMENQILKKTSEVEALIGSSKYVKYETIKALTVQFPVTALCKKLNASTSTYYLYLKRNPIKFDLELAKLILKIHQLRMSSGYRTIKRILKRKYNIIANHKKIQRIMKHLNICGKQKRRKYYFNKNIHQSKIYPNILNRNFNAQKSNQKWVIDITYIKEKYKNTYLVSIKDLYDKRIVSFKNSVNMNTDFVIDCVKNAFIDNKIKPNQLIIHSDQGYHFTCSQYIKLLENFTVTGSHSRKGNCHDNAPIESFFSIYKREAFNFKRPKDLNDTIKLTKEFMHYYNFERVQKGLNEKTPTEFYQSN